MQISTCGASLPRQVCGLLGSLAPLGLGCPQEEGQNIVAFHELAAATAFLPGCRALG